MYIQCEQGKEHWAEHDLAKVNFLLTVPRVKVKISNLSVNECLLNH